MVERPLEREAGAGAPADDERARAGLAPHAALMALERALARPKRRSFRHLLVLRFALVNLAGAALLGAAALEGWVAAVLAADATRLVVVIFATFVFGLALCARRVVQTGRELDLVEGLDPLAPSRVSGYLAAVRGRGAQSRAITAAALRLRLFGRISGIRHIANILVVLGLIGTVIGFIIALSGVKPEAASAVETVGPMVATLISGMSVALYTTLVGAVLNVWLMINYQLLAGGTVKLVTALTDLGESHAAD